jgi:hypothetical protein
VIALRAVPLLIVLCSALAVAACSDDDGDPVPTNTIVTDATSTPVASTPAPEPTPPPQPTSATLTVEIPADVVAGGQFTATVRIDGVTDLGAYQLRPQFDDAGLQLISVQDGGFLASTGRIPACQTSAPEGGVPTYFCVTAGTQPPGPSGAGVLATITVQALVAGTYDLTLADVQVTTPNGTEAPVTVAPATVTVR